MKIREYNQFPFTISFTLATPRPDGAPSTVIVAAKKHEEYASQVRGVLREFKHIAPTDAEVPAALRLQNYFPTASSGGQTIPIYFVRVLAPGPSVREVDVDFWQDVYRMRYSGLLVLTPAFIPSGERVAYAFERNLEYAVRQLFTYCSLPTNFIPGDDADRPDDRTVIDIIAEIGAAEGAPGLYEVPTPT
jgi:hypothetical protein